VADQNPATTGDETESSEQPKQKSGKHFIAIGVIAVLVVGALLFWWRSTFYEDTDDAQINGHLIQVSSRIAGQVIKIYVDENQEVKAGDPICDLDPKDFQVAVQQDEANLQAAEAAFESANTLIPTCLGGVNFVLHTAGWLEGGLAMGYEKFVMDADQAGMMHTLLAGVDLSDNGQALDAIREVGPGKHFLGCAHTQANFENAFYRSPLADNNSFEQWEAEGATDMAKRANTLWKKQLAEYEAPPLDPAIDEALLDFIKRRKASFPDSNF